MIISHNISALNANNHLRRTNTNLSKTMEKLSSGLRINRASDDAAGLAISEKMKYQINGTRQAIRNAQDGISLVQTAEGALQEVHALLHRMNELATEAANGTYTDNDRKIIQAEFEELINEIDNISRSSKFNDISLLDGGNGNNIVWNEIDNGSSVNYWDISTNGEMFLAVGIYGNLLASKDGVNWYEPAKPVTEVNLNTVNWDGQHFLIGEGSNIYASTDGSDRKGYSHISGLNGRWFDVDFVGGRYFAVGDDGQLATTTDPTVLNGWVPLVSGTNEQLLDVTSSGSEYVIVGRNGTIIRSIDGVKWELQSSGITNDINAVIWAEDQYIAVGNRVILTSSDGITWTQVANPTAIFRSVIHDGNQFIAASNGSLYISKDGITWEEQDTGYAFYNINSMSFNGGRYVGIGNSGKAVVGFSNKVIPLQIGVHTEQTLEIHISAVNPVTIGIHNITVNSQEDALNAIESINDAIVKISSERSQLGSYQNRLEHVINNLHNSNINLTASESRIRDADMAREMMKLTQNQILANAGQTMLAQANALPNTVLQLLQ